MESHRRNERRMGSVGVPKGAPAEGISGDKGGCQAEAKKLQARPLDRRELGGFGGAQRSRDVESYEGTTRWQKLPV